MKFNLFTCAHNSKRRSFGGGLKRAQSSKKLLVDFTDCSARLFFVLFWRINSTFASLYVLKLLMNERRSTTKSLCLIKFWVFLRWKLKRFFSEELMMRNKKETRKNSLSWFGFSLFSSDGLMNRRKANIEEIEREREKNVSTRWLSFGFFLSKTYFLLHSPRNRPKNKNRLTKDWMKINFHG